MYLKDLLGKKVIRTEPVKYPLYDYSDFNDRAFMETPIFVWFATDHFAVYSYVDGYSKDDKRILQKEWLDDKWMDCEWLLKTANKEHLELILQEREPDTGQENKDKMVAMFDQEEVDYLRFTFDCATKYMKTLKTEFKEQANFDVDPAIQWIKETESKMISK